jgi:hypothetical protein
VTRANELLATALCGLSAKPAETAPAAMKKRYSELVSNAVAPAFAAELRARGLTGSRPAPPGPAGASGAERRMAGAIGAKKVDVTWATEESGLLLAISIKSINWRDARSSNFQKNMTNRRGDLLYEAVTLHRRFPYAVLGGFIFLDKDAANDGTPNRRSTFLNAHSRLRLFDGRNDPAGRDEQYERLYVVLLDATPAKARWEIYRVGDPVTTLDLADVFSDLVALVVERNPDFYEVGTAGNLLRTP